MYGDWRKASAHTSCRTQRNAPRWRAGERKTQRAARRAHDAGSRRTSAMRSKLVPTLRDSYAIRCTAPRPRAEAPGANTVKTLAPRITSADAVDDVAQRPDRDVEWPASRAGDVPFFPPSASRAAPARAARTNSPAWSFYTCRRQVVVIQLRLHSMTASECPARHRRRSHGTSRSSDFRRADGPARRGPSRTADDGNARRPSTSRPKIARPRTI